MLQSVLSEGLGSLGEQEKSLRRGDIGSFVALSQHGKEGSLSRASQNSHRLAWRVPSHQGGLVLEERIARGMGTNLGQQLE